MSDTHTMEAPTIDAAEETSGHGRHRGPVSANDAETTPRGRHRKPAEQTESAA
ncbi:hypothetical protein ACFS5L_31975 [Streptomyces phyllanthi]|uniref:hypothetical protein n=1 Tax=Streptomyces phyllanthi TaxID=1803180 RepID=UPI0018845362|nr:hypothetical protein [Streptomyces phyllanthi]